MLKEKVWIKDVDGVKYPFGVKDELDSSSLCRLGLISVTYILSLVYIMQNRRLLNISTVILLLTLVLNVLKYPLLVTSNVATSTSIKVREVSDPLDATKN
jgi:hypothetical protein